MEGTRRQHFSIKTINKKLKQIVSLTHFKLDDLEWYGRKENIRFHNIPEEKSDKEDGEAATLKIAEALEIDFDPEKDIHPVHRLGIKNQRNGVVVRASASQSVELGFIS